MDLPSGFSVPPPQVPEHPYTDIPNLPQKYSVKPGKNIKPFIPLILLVGFLPVITGAVLYRQYLQSQASPSGKACRVTPDSVRIHPGLVTAAAGSPPVQMSALLYDNQQQPINGDVAYEWGMSSSVTIGNLSPRNKIAAFTPLASGSGDIFVSVDYCGIKVTGSVPVTVSAVSPAPTCRPAPKCLTARPPCLIPVPVGGWCRSK